MNLGVTVGRDGRGGVLGLVHTFSDTSADERKVRIISVRKATQREMGQYEEVEQ